VQGLGDWKAPVCQQQKSAANEAKRNNSFSRNQGFKTCPPGQVFICFSITTKSSKVEIKKVGFFRHF
jgi:hypothetical protein